MKIALAGIEVQEKNDAAYAARAPSLLTSFYYADGIERTCRFRLWEASLRQARFRLADSGAHSFRADARHGRSVTASVKLDRYLEDYLLWLRRFRGLLDFWFELDVGIVSGTEWVARARERTIRAGFGDGLILAWHPAEHTWADWLWMLNEAKGPGRSRYVAIEGRNSENNIAYAQHLQAAYQAGVRVHAFRMTAVEDMRRWPFYSVDSTSWGTSATYGVKQVLDREGWPHALHTSGRGGVKPRPDSLAARSRRVWGGRLPSRGAGRRVRVDELTAAARAWSAAEASLTDYWLGRGVDWEAAMARRTA